MFTTFNLRRTYFVVRFSFAVRIILPVASDEVSLANISILIGAKVTECVWWLADTKFEKSNEQEL